TASITHELRTPLTVIQAASDNLNSNLISKERIPTYGKLIKQQTERLNNMIENLLVFSKIENNKAYKLNPSNINLANMIEQIELQFKSIANEKNIQIKWTKTNLNKNILLDKTIYELILSNLINNSIFHAYNGQKGEVRVTIHYSDQKKSINTIIEDDGRGIPVKEQKYIWKSYYRGKKSINEQERGSGLGLFIVNRNVSILGGKVNLSSPYKRLNGKINNGCKFEFYIPCKEIK
ncbi:MAG: HAMP domain-containing sensor histidine kinase, partial [Sphaerochaetaceae bacterium]|nr:HAMP domain-containing sensor histidine kinase [Sphaerochaetaceae bacterium]